MTNPLVFGGALLVFIGLVVPFFMGYFVDTSNLDVSPLVTPFINIIDNGISFFGFSINPFAILGDTISDFMIRSLTFFGILPESFIILFLVIITLAIFVGTIKLFPTT